DTFVIDKVLPYFTNKLKEIVKNPKYYFYDPGIRNFALSNFQEIDLRHDKGFLFETFIFQELTNILDDKMKLKFWRTKVGAEVDFVFDWKTKAIPLECKSKMKKPVLSRSFQNFLNYYNISKGIVLTSDFFMTDKFGSTEIYFIPYHWFPFIKHEFFS
ncbi:MAG TPA: DUF4143 domain-containing protein, partial [bacterium]|nr:DUF4143 domain-containing protein [bacterium]